MTYLIREAGLILALNKDYTQRPKKNKAWRWKSGLGEWHRT